MQSVNHATNCAQFQGTNELNSYLKSSRNDQPSAGTLQLDGIRAQLRQLECNIGLNKLVTERLCVRNAALEGKVLAQEERMDRLEERVSKEPCKHTHFSENLEKDSQASEKSAEENLVSMKNEMKHLQGRVLGQKDAIYKLYQRTHALENQVKVSQASERATMENLANMRNEMGHLREEMKRVNSFFSTNLGCK